MKSLFEGEQTHPPAGVKNCTRCGIRCRCAEKVNSHANLFVKGDAKTGKFCVNCLVVDFFKNGEYGGQPIFEQHYMDPSLPQPEWRKEVGDKDVRFDPECLRMPHVQQQFAALAIAAMSSSGAELDPVEIEWDAVIKNWNLPFRSKKTKTKGDA